jgi:hypothetical protein
MTTPDQDTNGAPALSALALGIVNDVQSLVKQQLALFQNELPLFPAMAESTSKHLLYCINSGGSVSWV